MITMRRIVSFTCVSLLPFACSGSGTDDLGDDRVTDDSGNDADGGGGQSAGSGGGVASGGSVADLPGPSCGKPADLGVRIVGRHDGCVEGSIRRSWSGTGFVARFNGTGLRVTENGGQVRYAVIVDGVPQADIVTEFDGEIYNLVLGLEKAEHTVEVFRQSEASFGTTTLSNVEVIDGELLPPPEASGRSIEIFGDSVTTGYGNEGESSSCSFSLETQNFYLSYGALLARGFDAEVSSVAFSGRGVVSNYDGQGGETVPELADRAIAALRSSVWDYSLLKEPDVVLINLGTNDYSTESDPTDDEFVEGYTGLLGLIRGRYPEAEIVGTVGPLLSGSDLSNARENIARAVAQLSDGGDEKVHALEIASDNPSPGCDYHPDLNTHAAMANELGELLEEITGWGYSKAEGSSAGGAGPN